jgi:hypothetical protein
MLSKIIHYGLYILVITLPITFKLDIIEIKSLKFSAKLPLGDIMITSVFILWLIKQLLDKSYKGIKLPPKLFWLFLFVAIISSAYSHSLKGSVKEVIQIFNYYILAYVLFINNINSSKHLYKILHVLVGITAIITLYGYYQYNVLENRSYLLSSFFEDRHVLSGFYVMMLPLHLSLFLIQRSTAMKILIGISLLAALGVLTSIPAYIILSAVLTGMLLYARKPAMAAVLFVVLILFIILPFGIQTQDLKTSFGGFYEPEGLDNYHKRVTKSVEMSYTPVIGSYQLGKHTLQFSSNLKTPAIIPKEHSEETITARSKDDLYVGRQLDQRLLEWQAALNLSGARPLLGVGIGSYQSEIGYYYQPFPKLNTMEPNTQNGYLIILATMGFIGLGVYFWILLFFWRMLRGLLGKKRNQDLFTIIVGIAGSFIGFCLYNIFCPLVNLTAVIFFVLILAFTAIIKELSGEELGTH